MKRMAYPASHFTNTSSEFVKIHSLNPNQSTLLTRVDLKETVNIHTCKTAMHMAQYRSIEIRYHSERGAENPSRKDAHAQ